MSPAFNLRNPVMLLIAAVALIVILASTLAVVPETRQAVIVRFGQPVSLVNAYRPGEALGKSGAGLIVRVPFLDQLVWIDKRAIDIDMGPQQLATSDQHPLKVDAFARYRIVDPLRAYANAGDDARVSDQLRPIFGAALRDAVAAHSFEALTGPGRAAVLRDVQSRLSEAARKYGAEILDVRIKSIDLPEGEPLDSAIDRMKSAREQQALAVEAEGQRQAQTIRAEGDAAAARIYADSFGKDPDFYAFYRAMQSYRRTLAADGTHIILSPNNAYLRAFGGGGR